MALPRFHQNRSDRLPGCREAAGQQLADTRIGAQSPPREGLHVAIEDGKTAQSVPGATDGFGLPVADLGEFA